MELLQNTSIFGWLLQFAMVIIAIIGVHQATKRAYEKKQNDVKTRIELKADNTRVDKMECAVTKKADISYVDDKSRVLHHRIDDSNGLINKQLDLLIESQKEFRTDIKDILKRLK